MLERNGGAPFLQQFEFPMLFSYVFRMKKVREIQFFVKIVHLRVILIFLSL